MYKHAFRCGQQVSALKPCQEQVATCWGTLSLGGTLKLLNWTEQPSIEDLVRILQICRRNKNLNIAKLAYKQICGYGLEVDTTVGNHIVPMLVECQSVSYAQQAFNRLIRHNEHSWTGLILGYIQCGKLYHAFDLYSKMQEEGVSPSAYTLTALLRSCAKIKDLKRGRNIHIDIQEKGMEKQLCVGNTLVHMYVKCGSLTEAREAFDKMLARDIVSWNTLIAGYTENGFGWEALKQFELLQTGDVRPNAVTYICSLKACCMMGAIDNGRDIHTKIAIEGFERDLIVCNALIDMYVRCGSVIEAWSVLDKMSTRDIVSWNTLIGGYAKSGAVLQVVTCLEQMQSEGIVPDAVTFVCCLKACNCTESINKVRDVHAQILRDGFEKDLYVGNALIHMYAQYGSLIEAQEVFEKLPVRDAVSWTSMIECFTDHGSPCAALKLFDQMEVEEVSPDVVTLVCNLKAVAKIGVLSKGQKIHAVIMEKSLQGDVFIGNSLIDMYIKCDSLVEAWKCFCGMPTRDIVSWTTLISSFVEKEFGEEALKCFDQLQLECFSPDAVVFGCILKACGSVGAIDKGRKLHIKIKEKGLYGSHFVVNNLIDMYVKYGSFTEAREVFDRLPFRDVVCWTTLISGYVENGYFVEALNCFDSMLMEEISPDSVALVCALKACSSICSIDKGRKVHTEISKRELDKDVFISSSLVNMYAKCGFLGEAKEIFDNMELRDIVSWTAIIAGYAEGGRGQEALECFGQLKLEGLSPDAMTFSSVLKACGSVGAADSGRQIHAEMEQRGFDRDIFVTNALIDMYINCDSLNEARQAFDKLSHRDAVSWNAVITGYVENGLCHEAIELFEHMQMMDGIVPNVVTFICILKSCSSTTSIEMGRKVHAAIVQKEFEKDNIACNTLMDMYAKCGSFEEACNVFNSLSVPDIVSWNTLIAGCIEHGLGSEVLRCLERMRMEGLSPDAFTFVSCLLAYAKTGAIDSVRGIHAEIVQMGYESNVPIGRILAGTYAKYGSYIEAQKAFEKLPIQDIASWSTLIAGYAENGPGEEVVKCFEWMQLQGVVPDSVAFVSGLRSCGSIGARGKGRRIHSEVVKRGFGDDPFIGTTLVSMYSKIGSLSEACVVFEKLPVRNVVSWNALVTAVSEAGFDMEVLKYFELMKLEGVSPDDVTFAFTLKACGNMVAIEEGRNIHTELFQGGFENHLLVANALIDMYAKCGLLAEAQKVFHNLSIRDVATWTTLIRAYGTNHKGDTAVECFEEMQRQGVNPDAITFICILTACSRANLLAKGQAYFKAMRMEHGITPSAEHYNCMVDLFARSGHLCEAQNLIETMHCLPLKETWLALLSACKVYKQVELGLRCFQKLVNMDSQHAASYIIMADIYASAGRWDDAKRIEELRKQTGAQKLPARALIEVNKKIHEFKVGDKQTEETSALLATLNSRLKEGGYIPTLDFFRAISDDEKEAALCGHAEKLAIAFGLLHTPQGQTLHLTKNLRMCSDCHNASKLISRIEKRDIVLREVGWDHHFRSGVCSCEDMW